MKKFQKALIAPVIALTWSTGAVAGAADTSFAVPEILHFEADGQPPRVQAELINPFSKVSITGALFDLVCSDTFGRDVLKSVLIVDGEKRQVVLDHLPNQEVDYVSEIKGPWLPRQKVQLDQDVKDEGTPVVTTCRALNLRSVW